MALPTTGRASNRSKRERLGNADGAYEHEGADPPLMAQGDLEGHTSPQGVADHGHLALHAGGNQELFERIGVGRQADGRAGVRSPTGPVRSKHPVVFRQQSPEGDPVTAGTWLAVDEEHDGALAASRALPT